MTNKIDSFLTQQGFRKLKWWIPEILNYLHLPYRIMWKARRQEIADNLRDARRRGIWINRHNIYRALGYNAPKKFN